MQASMPVSPEAVPTGTVSRVWWAKIISFFFHPLFVPALVAGYILFLHPVYPLLAGRFTAMQVWLSTTLNTVLYPGLLALLLWRLGFIKSLEMHEQRERIIPLVANILFYFWAWYVSRNTDSFPAALKEWLMAVFLCSCAAMFTNIFMKMSLHGIAWGAVFTYSIIQPWHDPEWHRWMPLLVALLAGLVGSARLRLAAHQPGELYAGYLAGAICALAATVVA